MNIPIKEETDEQILESWFPYLRVRNKESEDSTEISKFFVMAEEETDRDYIIKL